MLLIRFVDLSACNIIVIIYLFKYVYIIIVRDHWSYAITIPKLCNM